jgi:hypothetical protein
MIANVTVDVAHGNRSFAFELCRRELDFGPAGRAPYYWMDGRQLRHNTLGPNFRACVDLWWTAVDQAGATGDPDNQANLVLAECYPLVNTARTLQDVYVDAHLHKQAGREFTPESEKGRPGRAERTYSLPQEEVARLRRLAASQDPQRVRAELEGLFLGEMPPEPEMPAFQKAAQSWIGNGMVALNQGGRPALRKHVAEVGKWIAKYRKQGDQDRVRRFVNMFAYESKVAFYLCYTSAWVGLLQKLVADGRTNVAGERFLRLWHHQNQPASDNHGVVGGARDVFCGQVLALHPLSAIVLNDSAHLATIGRWLAHAQFDALQQSGRQATCPEYWDVVATILEAAHEYVHARDQWEATRGNVTQGGTVVADRAVGNQAPGSVALFFEDFADGRQLVCPTCQQELDYSSHETSNEDEGRVQVLFRCRVGHEHQVSWTEEELRKPPPESE